MRLNRSYFDESIASSSWLIHSWNLFSLAKGTDHGRYLVQQDMARLYGQKVFGRRCYSSPWVLLSRTSSFWCFLGIRAALPFLSMMLPWLRCHNSWSQYMYSQEWYPPVIKHGNGKSPTHRYEFPIKSSIYKGFPIEIVDCQSVSVCEYHKQCL